MAAWFGRRNAGKNLVVGIVGSLFRVELVREGIWIVVDRRRIGELSIAAYTEVTRARRLGDCMRANTANLFSWRLGIVLECRERSGC